MISRMFDASRPPSTAPTGFQAVLGYVGKPGFTPHVWTPEEWQPFAHLRQFPCYVPDLAAAPNGEALAAVAAVKALGWAAHMPDVRAIVFDFETAEGPYDRAWWETCAATVGEDGFCGVPYGSLSTIFELAASDVIVAAWDNNGQLEPGQTAHGHQYLAGVPYQNTQIDYSVIDEWLFARGGRGARRI